MENLESLEKKLDEMAWTLVGIIKEAIIDDVGVDNIDNEELESVVTDAIKTYLKTPSKVE